LPLTPWQILTCASFVAAFNEGGAGSFAHDWRPQFKELDEEWEEVRIPEKGHGAGRRLNLSDFMSFSCRLGFRLLN
jgi:hypothetical protein